MQKIIVTGGLGFIGSNLIELLLENKFIQGDKISVDIKKNEFTFSSNKRNIVKKKTNKKDENPQKV